MEATHLDDSLGDRERAILELIEQGLSDREIGAKCHLSLNTVKWYNHQIYAKLGVTNRTQAVSQARQRGLLSSPSSASATPTMRRVSPEASASHQISNLPIEATRFVGRQRECEAIKTLIQTTRLVTLIGPPGTGKTRLCLHTAKEIAALFIDGVRFVNLASIQEPTHVAACIADALRIETPATDSILETLKSELRTRRMLLILDNFEHVIDGADVVGELMTSTSLTFLVTSREQLRIYGEHIFAVPPLQLPDEHDTASIAQSESVALFVQQAQATKSGWTLNRDNQADIARICARLGGLPLAIELAAAQSVLFSPQTLLQRLESPLTTLARGPRNLPTRQQSLRQTIDWSYDLLSSGDKKVFEHLSVFSGGWTIESATGVCADLPSFDAFAALESLLSKSLIHQYEINGMLRFGMLEMLREYALEKLKASGDYDAVCQRHARYFTEFAHTTGHNTLERWALDQLELEHDNFRGVLLWSAMGRAEPGLRLIAELSQCWRMRGHLTEGWRWTQNLLAKSEQVPTDVKLAALAGASLLAENLGKTAEAVQLAEEALALANKINDPLIRAQALLPIGLALIHSGMTESESQRSEQVLGEALRTFRERHHELGTARALVRIGELHRVRSVWEQAAAANCEALHLMAKLGNLAGLAVCNGNLGWVSLRLGDSSAAGAHFRASVEYAQQVIDQIALVVAVAGLAACATVAGQHSHATTLFGTCSLQLHALGARLVPADQADYDVYLGMARQAMSEFAFDAAWRAGEKMTLTQAVASALEAALVA